MASMVSSTAWASARLCLREMLIDRYTGGQPSRSASSSPDATAAMNSSSGPVKLFQWMGLTIASV